MLKNFFQFFLAHSIFIGIGAAAMAFETLTILSFGASYSLFLFLFFSTISAYNFYWITSGINGKQNFLSSFFNEKLTNYIIFILSAIAAVYYFFEAELLWEQTLILVCLTVAYSLPLIKAKPFIYLQKIGFLKPFLLALTWAYATVFFPLQDSFIRTTGLATVLFINRFIFILILCIIFEKKDKELDKANGVKTLVTILSPRFLYKFVMFLFFIWSFSNIAAYIYGVFNYQAVALQLVTVFTYLVYLLSSKKRGYYFYYFLVDGLMILSAIIITLFTI